MEDLLNIQIDSCDKMYLALEKSVLKDVKEVKEKYLRDVSCNPQSIKIQPYTK